MNHDLIIFDCDGTLVDSELLCNTALVEVLNENGVTDYNIDYALKHWVGKTFTDVLVQVQTETGATFPEGIGQSYIQKSHEKYQTDLGPVKHANDLVKRCAANFDICVGSNGERNNVMDSLSICGFLPEFFTEENIFTRIQVPQGKPAPDLFLFAAANMNREPAKSLVIEDSISGVKAGVAAGMEVWGFTGVSHTPKKQTEIMKKAGASHVFTSLIHIAEQLGV